MKKPRRKKLTDEQAEEIFVGILAEAVVNGDKQAERLMETLYEEGHRMLAYIRYTVRGPLALLPERSSYRFR